jgi:hypothetical protein
MQDGGTCFESDISDIANISDISDIGLHSFHIQVACTLSWCADVGVVCSSNLNSSHELQKARRDATCAGKHLETSWKYHSLSTSALQDVSKSVVYRISVQQGFNKQSARHAPTPSPQCMQPHAIVLDVLDLIAKYRGVEYGSEHRHGCFGEVARLAAAPTLESPPCSVLQLHDTTATLSWHSIRIHVGLVYR